MSEIENSDEEDEDEFALTARDFEELGLGEKYLKMSEQPALKNYPFSRKTTSQSLIDTDSEDENAVDTNPGRFITKESFDESIIESEGPKLPSAGPSTRSRIKSPDIRDKKETLSVSDSDESDEMGVTKKKKRVVSGEYDPGRYANLDVSNEIKEIFQYITKYIPQQLNLDYKFKPFIPDFIPAVGDIDAFLKIIPPEKTLSGDIFNSTDLQLGLTVLDEPASNQSDPALLHLQLRASSINATHTNQMMVVKKVDDIEKNSKVIDKWIKDVSELHRNKAATAVKYTNPMPDLDELMQEWPEQFENAIKLHDIPSSDFCGPLSQYVDIISSIFDVPVHKNKIHSLHLMFSLYAAIKNSQLYQESNGFEAKDNLDISNNNKTDHLVLD